MAKPLMCIVDRDLPLNEDFYKQLVERMEQAGLPIEYTNQLNPGTKSSIPILLASVVNVKGMDNQEVILGLRTINRKERLQVAEQVVAPELIARWAAPENDDELHEVLQAWAKVDYVFKYDWSAGRRGVKLLNLTADSLPDDYQPRQDIVMEYLNEDPYTYKADLCCGVLLNAWFLRTVDIQAGDFNEYTKKPTQYQLPENVREQLEKLSLELMRYGAAYISIDMMKYEGTYKIIEINTNSVGRNISWQRFGETYLNTYPKGLKNLLEYKETLPTLGEVRRLKNQTDKILPHKHSDT